jgi:histidine phosphotransferase ChpT
MTGQALGGRTEKAIRAAGERGSAERFLLPDGKPAEMTDMVDIRVLELLVARLCHELSGPIAAINNGVEIIEEDDVHSGPSQGTGFEDEPLALISDSARRAGNRLRFYRFAYGFSPGSVVSGPSPYELASGIFDSGRFVCDYSEGIRRLPSEWQKLACNLLSVGAETLPRGGRLSLSDNPLTLEAIGEPAALSPETRAALLLAPPIDELTARTVQAYFTGLLAKVLGRILIATVEPGRVRLTAAVPRT